MSHNHEVEGSIPPPATNSNTLNLIITVKECDGTYLGFEIETK